MLARVWPRVGDGDANYAGVDGVTAGWDLIREIGVRAQDFQGFLLKLESISRLI